MNVPDPENNRLRYFSFKGVAAFKHEVSGVEDKRSLLPSRGIQSDHPDIRSLAEDITANKETEYDKAKAVYEYVAKTIAYDVQKWEDDLFELGDSALKTIELKKRSLPGLCLFGGSSLPFIRNGSELYYRDDDGRRTTCLGRGESRRELDRNGSDMGRRLY